MLGYSFCSELNFFILNGHSKIAVLFSVLVSKSLVMVLILVLVLESAVLFLFLVLLSHFWSGQFVGDLGVIHQFA